MDISSLLFYFNISDESLDLVENDERIIRRKLRDKSNPLSLSTRAFEKRFRLNKEAFNYVLSKLHFSGHLSTAVPPNLQLAATLSLLSSGGFQHCVGNDYLIGMCPSTVSKMTSNVIAEIENKLCPDHIIFDPPDSAKCKEHFVTKYQIPGVIDCADGTHIELQRPSQNEHMFFNRKGFHSLNTMIICNHKYKINAVNAQYGGEAHDSFIWRHSDQRNFLENEFLSNENQNSWILGDSWYPLEPWCITPYRSPLDGSRESVFNDVHSKARCIVERTIGILKGRWKILLYGRKGRYSPEKIAKFVNVCCALHNICIQFKIPFHLARSTPSADEPAEIEFGQETHLTRIGETIRNNIKNSLFLSLD